jgi:long-chain acyl-CoA synthetase
MGVLNHIVATPPPAGHRIRVLRLDGERELTLTQVHEAAGRLARALAADGIGPGDRIGILAANGLDWVLLDLAALRLKAVTAGFEPGKFDPDPALLDRYQLAVLFTDRPATGPGIRPMSDIAVLTSDEGLAEGDALADGEGPPPRYGPRDITTIKFTSGSTGEPKGLAATAGSIDASISAVQDMFGHGPGDDLLLFLPLSLLQQRYWIYSALRYGHDITISSYEAAFVALRRAQPTVVMGVPGFYESARKQIEARAARSQDPDPVPAAAAAVFGGRIRYLWTGSAPARPSMLRFFTEAGMAIYEGYGLNETCIVAKNHPGAHREGSVGQVLPGKKVLIDTDGVISVQSEHPVNWHYEYCAPGDSEKIFGPDGVVRTGDLGYLDADGFLYIAGRADDVIVLDNGKKVIVRPLEEYLKASPAIDECVVLCPTQTHLVAVVSPAAEPPDHDAITAHLAAANAAFSKDEQIASVVVAPERFSVANGLLTAQFKPRRQRILERYWSPR